MVRKPTKGVSTIELLIAFAILTLTLTAIISLAFGNLSVTVDTQVSDEALARANREMEKTRALAQSNFLSASSTSKTETVGNITYTLSMLVSDVSPCEKIATSTVSWNQGALRPLSTSVVSLITDVAGALSLGGDCSPTIPTGNWRNPQHLGSLNSIAATGIDVRNRIAYLALKKTNPANSADLWIIDATVSTAPTTLFQGDINNYKGFNAIDVATSTNGHLYAYVASDLAGSGQIQVIDVTNSASPTRVATASSTLPRAVTGIARSLYYYDEKLYVGTQYLACASCAGNVNNEFHIFDVSDPTHPVWQASIKVNRNVNSIMVQNGYAYLAIGPGTAGPYTPFKIYDVNPSSGTYLQEKGSLVTTGNEEGTAVYVLGNRAYLGLEHTPSSRPDLFVLNVSNPSSVQTVTSTALGLHSGSAVTGIRVSQNLIFVGVSDSNVGLEIRDSGNIGTRYNTSPYNYQQNTTGIDFENNKVYLSASSGSASFEIVGPGP